MTTHPPRRATRRGFTLVELVTAASLMTVMMMGVVEIFGIVAQTAGDAEGIHFAQQQARALFNRLHTDIRGMTREGYLAIKKGSVLSSTGAYEAQTAAASSDRYGADTLAFVTIGSCQPQMDDGAQDAASAEVVYTNQVETPNQVLQVDGEAVAPRRGILGRGLWLLDESQAAGGGLWNSLSGRGLCELFASENAPFVAQKNPLAAPPLPDMLQSGAAADNGALAVEPWLEEKVAADRVYPGSLNRVMACCVSEFYVETFSTESLGTDYWHGGDAERTYRWSWSGEDEDGVPVKSWPPAIRVTVAIHDPGNTEDIPTGQNRFRGYVMQETFWLGDP